MSWTRYRVRLFVEVMCGFMENQYRSGQRTRNRGKHATATQEEPGRRNETGCDVVVLTSGHGKTTPPATEAGTSATKGEIERWKVTRDNDMAVYLIRNTQTGRVYVGGSTQVFRRWKQHCWFLDHGKGQPGLQPDWDTYGADAFVFEIIAPATDAGALVDAEQALMDRMRAEGHELYNRRLSAQSTYGGMYWPRPKPTPSTTDQ